MLVLSGIAILLGIGQRTVFAPPADVTMGTSQRIATHYAVIPAEALNTQQGSPSIQLQGTNAVVVTGDLGDVRAWVAGFDHVELAADVQTQTLGVTEVQGELPAPSAADQAGASAPAAPEATASPQPTEANAKPVVRDPRGSDLWLQEASETDAREVVMPVNLSDTQAVLVATAGDSPLAEGVSVSWAQDRRTPFAGPLLVGGGVLAAVGAVLYLLAVDHDRRGLGPRRGRKGPLIGIRDSFKRRRDGRQRKASEAPARTAKRVALPALAIAGLLGLSGCSSEYWPSLAADPVQVAPPVDANVAHVPVTRAQIDRIIDDVATVSNEADDQLKAELLKPRFAGDALQQRAANYTIRAAVSDYDLVPPRITNQQLGYELVQSTDAWPRTMFITVASGVPAAESTPPTTSETTPSDAAQPGVEKPEAPSLALMLTQLSPHDNFKVDRVFTLRGGIAMPEAAPAEEGTALLANNLQTLVLSPTEVGAAYAAALAGDKSTPQAALFDFSDDKLMENSGAAWVALAQENAAANGQEVDYSVTVQPSSEPVVSLSTGAGGALVAATLVENRVADSGGGKWKPTADASVTALSGLSGRQERIVRQVTHQLLFFVPNKGSNQHIQLLGTSTQMVGASN